MQTLRWDDLPFFLAVVRGGTLTAAADEMGVNHSTAWRRLKSIEDALGVPLFDRTPQGYALTPVGEAMLGPAERVEEEVFALQRAVAGTDSAPRGVVRVTAPESMLPLLTPMFVAFRQQHRGIVLDLQMGDRFYDLDRREADVAIRPGPEPPAGAVGRRVSAVAWTVYGPATVDRDDCDRLPWVGYSDALSRLAAVRWRRERGGEPIVTVNTVPAMRCFLSRTHGRGMLPCFAGDADPLLQRLQDPIPEAGSALWLLVHADLRRNARVRLLADHAWEALRAAAPALQGQLSPD